MQSWKNKAVVMCSNNFCRRTSPGDGPTCRWHVRNYGSEDDPVNVTLCNACKINFDQGKYCPFCVQIYRERDPDSFDKKQWIGCTNRNCRRWSHEECEMEYGIDVSKIDRRSYQCPGCRDAGKHSDSNDRRRLGRHNAAHSQCTTSPSFFPRSPPVQHSDSNDRRRLGRHNAADRLAIAQAAAAAAEAGGATGGEKDRRGNGGGADKAGGSGSPGRILFGGGAGGGGGGGGSGLQDSLHSPNPSSDSTPGDHADSANRVDRVDQSKPELAIDQRIHPVDHIDQIDQTDPMDTTDDKEAGEVEGEEGERERNRKSSSGGHHSNNSQDNSNEYDNSEYGWRKSPVAAAVGAGGAGGAAAAAAAAATGSVLPRSSKRVQGSSAKPLKVDLSKLQTSSLRRYKRVYKLRDASSGKEELKLAVAQHFASLVSFP
ncbi:unnamed protein product [Closterium sp. Yama58-4]|nr:unnamed protein product [Closterium sp. Yama58-4]